MSNQPRSIACTTWKINRTHLIFATTMFFSKQISTEIAHVWCYRWPWLHPSTVACGLAVPSRPCSPCCAGLSTSCWGCGMTEGPKSAIPIPFVRRGLDDRNSKFLLRWKEIPLNELAEKQLLVIFLFKFTKKWLTNINCDTETRPENGQA